MENQTEKKPETMFLFGNGLSIGLSPEFALKTITQKFINSLEGNERAFLEEISGSNGLNFDNFEENFSAIEDALDGLRRYDDFMITDVGKKFLKRFSLSDPMLSLHRNIIESIYQKYIFMILELIIGQVSLPNLFGNLGAFTKTFRQIILDSKCSHVFTLNYDLIVETILLNSEKIGTDNLTDFCTPAGNLSGTNVDKFDFDPARSKEFWGPNHLAKLYHLHGSLSMFFDRERNKAFKTRSQDILENNLYQEIHSNHRHIVPAIITGGGKSKKVQQYPFEFYNREMKRLCDFGDVSKLFIVGYSFRDEHINDYLNRWISNTKDIENGLRIIDYKDTEDNKKNFIRFISESVMRWNRKNLPTKCFVFEGANALVDIQGSERKPK